ncbi:dipeptidyl-peptidase 3 [Penicillium angulare]|uniref:Dipeptidyl-peptidase 3 n=1 Tax=Penicillium angulare TaxID=116970 RepID=A0A9W9KK87_9EURO|nr:dipeptidyl-peptidase 3 [Penicillium angulare]
MAVTERPSEIATTHALESRKVFESVVENEILEGKSYTLYAHHLARACWHGTRVLLRQTSPEAEGIYDLIIELHRACGGQWSIFCDRGVQKDEVDSWLDFAGMFMSSFGNYFNEGNRKAIPNVSPNTLKAMATISQEANKLLDNIIEPLFAIQPSRLGYPTETSQSNYYPGKEKITEEEIDAITDMIEDRGIGSENTRLRKLRGGEGELIDTFHVLLASAEKGSEPQLIEEIVIGDQQRAKVFLCRGDHAVEMEKASLELMEARKYCSPAQQTELLDVIRCFQTGNYQSAFVSSRRAWVTDRNPRVEHCIGWLSAYRDPNSARTDWQGAVGFTDANETEKMRQLVERSTEFLCTLPWAMPGVNGGKGYFEWPEMNVPNFEIVHALAFASNIIWEATNTNLNNKDGSHHGSKSILFWNRMLLNSRPGRPCYYVHPSEAQEYMINAHILRFNGTVIHELLGHGSGKLLSEPTPGEFNFDHENPPISPVTGEPINTWYKPKETWYTVFGTLSQTVEECRAFLFAYYLADNKEILSLFGYDDSSTPTADDLIYYTYLHLGVEGLQALGSFKAEEQTWGSAHDRALFAILNHLLQDGGGVLSVECNAAEKKLTLHVDRSKLLSHGKPSIGRMLCKIHIWHSTADINACRPFYEALSTVDEEFEMWRQIVVSNPEPKWKFVQPNTFLRADGTVELREYEASNEGIICSFLERNV